MVIIYIINDAAASKGTTLITFFNGLGNTAGLSVNSELVATRAKLATSLLKEECQQG